MDKLFPPSRRRILTVIATIALSTGGFAVAQADDAVPLRVGVLTDMSSLYADITGPGSVAAAKMAVEDFLAGPHKMKRQIEVVSGDHMNKADLGANSPGNGSIATTSKPLSTCRIRRWRSPFAISCSKPTRSFWSRARRPRI